MDQHYVWAYTSTGSGCSAVKTFLQCTSENQGENKRKTILQTHIIRDTLLQSGRFPCLKTIFSISSSSFGFTDRSSFWAMVMQNIH